jgi:hypothetical protein
VSVQNFDVCCACNTLRCGADGAPRRAREARERNITHRVQEKNRNESHRKKNYHRKKTGIANRRRSAPLKKEHVANSKRDAKRARLYARIYGSRGPGDPGRAGGATRPLKKEHVSNLKDETETRGRARVFTGK